MLANPCELITAGASALYKCEPFGDYTRIRTPFLYPDGDVVDLFLRDDGQNHTLTDLGETLRWLKMQTPSLRRTAKQSALVEDVCQTLGIEFFRGTLNVRVGDPAAFTDEVIRLSQACLRVADIWFTFRTRTFEPVTEEIAAFLVEKGIPFSQNEKVTGRSTSVWNMDFHTRAPNRSSFVQVLSTGSRGATRRLVDHAVTAWFDLSHLANENNPTKFVTLFDDLEDVWDEEDFKLLSSISSVKFWSRSDEFLETIIA